MLVKVPNDWQERIQNKTTNANTIEEKGKKNKFVQTLPFILLCNSLYPNKVLIPAFAYVSIPKFGSLA